MYVPCNLVQFPYAKRLEQVMGKTNFAMRDALRKLRESLDQQRKNNVVDMEDAREEIKMNHLGW